MAGVQSARPREEFDMGDKRNEGLHSKFRVERVNPMARERHKNCWVFVLDPAHDPIARVALNAYEDAAREAGYIELAEDLRAKGWRAPHPRPVVDREALEKPSDE